MLSEKLAELLQRTRKQLGLSREELARRAQVSTRLLAELERGERPNVSLESTLKLLSLVGVSIVARAPDGATAEIRNARSISLERIARAALRRRTWTGVHVQLHKAGEPPSGGRSHAERLSAVSQLSKQAFALSATGGRSHERIQAAAGKAISKGVATTTRHTPERRSSSRDRRNLR